MRLGSELSNLPRDRRTALLKGQSICAAFMFFTAFLALSLRFLLVLDNQKLYRAQGDVSGRDRKDVAAAENNGPDFRYVL